MIYNNSGTFERHIRIPIYKEDDYSSIILRFLLELDDEGSLDLIDNLIGKKYLTEKMKTCIKPKKYGRSPFNQTTANPIKPNLEKARLISNKKK